MEIMARARSVSKEHKPEEKHLPPSDWSQGSRWERWNGNSATEGEEVTGRVRDLRLGWECWRWHLLICRSGSETSGKGIHGSVPCEEGKSERRGIVLCISRSAVVGRSAGRWGGIMMSLIGNRPWKWNGRPSAGERSRQKVSPEGEQGALNTWKTRLNTGKEQEWLQVLPVCNHCR